MYKVHDPFLQLKMAATIMLYTDILGEKISFLCKKKPFYCFLHRSSTTTSTTTTILMQTTGISLDIFSGSRKEHINQQRVLYRAGSGRIGKDSVLFEDHIQPHKLSSKNSQIKTLLSLISIQLHLWDLMMMCCS